MAKSTSEDFNIAKIYFQLHNKPIISDKDWEKCRDCFEQWIIKTKDSCQREVCFLELLKLQLSSDQKLELCGILAKYEILVSKNYEKAHEYYSRCDHLPWYLNPTEFQLFSNLSNSLLVRWTFRMLNDKSRNESFFKALEASINGIIARQNTPPIILDIGSGTGLLSLYAKQLNCEKVIGVEQDELMHKLSLQICDVAGIELINAHSSEIIEEHEFDIVVSETLDSIGIGEGIIDTFSDITKTGPQNIVLIPNAIQIYGFLISCETLHRCHFHSENMRSSAGTRVDNYCCEYIKEFPDLLSLTSPKNILKFDLYNSHTYQDKKTTIIQLVTHTSGWCHGFVSYFIADLFGDISITSAPDIITTSSRRCSCWEQGYHPLPRRWLERGTEVRLKLESTSHSFTVAWIVSDVPTIDYNLVEAKTLKYINSNFAKHDNKILLNTIPKLIDPSGVLLDDPMTIPAVKQLDITGMVIASDHLSDWVSVNLTPDRLLLPPSFTTRLCDLVNRYRSVIHEGVPMTTLPHHVISDTQTLITLERCSYRAGVTHTRYHVIRHPQVLSSSALFLILWYKIHFTDSTVFSSKLEELWRPAAYAVGGTPFQSDGSVALACSYKDGNMAFQLTQHLGGTGESDEKL